MKVIAAGYPKTGTKTMCAALRILGYSVYDFEENSSYLVDEWTKIIDHGWTTEDFRKMYQNIDAVTDYPACCFWEEIYKAFPDSKIILMIRDDEETWYKSEEKQLRENEGKLILRLINLLSPTGRKLMHTTRNYPRLALGVGESLLWKPFGWSHYNKELFKLKYRAHNAYVLQNAPPEKLLVFKCKQGWKPLCDFLNVPILDQPFPHKNKAASLTDEILDTNPFVPKLKREVMISITVIVIFISIVVYLVLASLF